jgi:methyltransferase (TIGR00027 family)
VLDRPPRIFEDTLAARLCGAEDEAELRARLDRTVAEITRRTNAEFAPFALRHLMASVILRGRYIEDELERTLASGVSQYVILGAGLDSFAYRRTDLANALRVFEVDHPATQEWKRWRLRELGVATPVNLSYVPVNFEEQSTLELLRSAGYRADAPALFSWLGVATYLRRETIFGVLRTIASLAVGTEIIFSYSLTPELLGGEARQVQDFIVQLTAARGEPLISFFDPASLAQEVQSLGFAEVWNFGPEEAYRRYCAERSDGLRPPDYVHLMGARV